MNTGNILSSETKDIGDKIREYLTFKDTSNEYKEILYEIHITIQDKNTTTQYCFEKIKTCYECVNQNCRCSCLIDGRVRRLQINNIHSHDILREFNVCTISEYAQNDLSGSVKFSNQNKEFEFNTKIIWGWCKNQIRIGVFEYGPRKLKVKLRSSPQKYSNSALDKAVKIMSGGRV